MFYTAIGAANAPSNIVGMYPHVASWFKAHRYILRCTNLTVLDMAAKSGCIESTARSEKPRFREYNVHHAFKPDTAVEIARMIHPKWDEESPSKQFHYATNAQLLFGNDCGDQASRVVIIWTENNNMRGREGHLIALANHFEIPVINFGLAHNQDEINILLDRMDSLI